MELEISERRIKFDKILSGLDKFVVNFTKFLNKSGVKYVVVSGYVVILFGRSRNTEDVDILVEEVSFEKFNKLWGRLIVEYDCLNAKNSEQAYKILKSEHAIRFSEKNKFIPNIEFKFVKDKIDNYALKGATVVIVNNNKFNISPIELQIVYKLFLGSEKDIEDARFLFKLFQDKLDLGELQRLITDFKIPVDVVKEGLGWK